jgi:uncharacterized membrane protein
MEEKSGVWEHIKSQFLVGLIIILPIAATVYVMWFLFTRLDNILGQYLPGRGLGFIALILIIWITGFIGQSKVGRTLVHYVRAAVLRTPIFGQLFKGFDEIGTKIIAPTKKRNFEHVVLVEYPKKNSFTLGFITSGESIIFKKAKPNQVVPVFVPTTPNPTSGYLLFYPKNKVHPIDIPVKKGMEIVFSMGIVHPEEYKIKKL